MLQSPKNRIAANLSASKPEPFTVKAFGHFNDNLLRNFSGTRAEAKRLIDSGLSHADVVKPIQVKFEAPQRWRICFINLTDAPEWRPTHVLDCPSSLRGCTDEFGTDAAPYRNSRDEAFHECAEYNAGRGEDGNVLESEQKWCFVIEFGTVERPSTIVTSEFDNDQIGREEILIRRAIRMVKPTADERAPYDGWNIGAILPDVGDPTQYRVYIVSRDKVGYRIWNGNFSTKAEATAFAKKQNAIRNDYNVARSAFVVVPPGPLPDLEKLQKIAAKVDA